MAAPGILCQRYSPRRATIGGNAGGVAEKSNLQVVLGEGLRERVIKMV